MPQTRIPLPRLLTPSETEIIRSLLSTRAYVDDVGFYAYVLWMVYTQLTWVLKKELGDKTK